MSCSVKEIRGFIVENYLFGQEMPLLTDEQSLLESGVIDSTGVMELVTFLEERYGITVEDDEIEPENLDTMRGIVAYVEGKLEPTVFASRDEPLASSSGV
ncbi:MAG: acyl carrier protein [Desulfobacteraceae bacterium]|nr:acyl carrier protein [Desulfobacteraceae bacterium]